MDGSNPKRLYIRSYKDLLISGCQYYLSRQDFLQKTGKEAPPLDKTKRIKKWQASDELGSFGAQVISLSTNGELLVDQDGNPYCVPRYFTAIEAVDVNLPDEAVYSTDLILPEFWIPLRDLIKPYEKLVSLKNAPQFSGNEIAYVLDSRYAPNPLQPTLADIMAEVKSVSSKLDLLLKQ